MRAVTWLLAAVLACTPLAAHAQQRVSFPSVGAGLRGKPDPVVDGYLFGATDSARPAVVLLHGCGGLVDAAGKLSPREVDWAARLTALGYVVLAVDSFTTRHQGQECAPGAPRTVDVGFDRVHDAYAALRFLRTLSFVDPDRIGVIGWSQGGQTVLVTLNDADAFGFSGDQGFRAAVAFYPSGCNVSGWSQPASNRLDWTTPVPLLVLFGGSDTWLSAAACEQFVARAQQQGAPASIQVYPGAYHDFDWPNLPRRELPQYTPRGRTVAPIVATDLPAWAAAIEQVKDFLARTLQTQR
ncbi:MAG TPA: dienelactone hydrolase family protein [Acetobacteraceae bacterium]|nr:dienelactone hydrolase family protein [Acetobacteraceae bacterium]